MGLYYLAPELIILVLKELDPVSLLRFCETCRRADEIAQGDQTLTYRLGLATSAMIDGPPSDVPPADRSQQLSTFRNAWLKFHWSHQDHLQLSPNSTVGVSGGFLFETCLIHSGYVLELHRLPCARVRTDCTTSPNPVRLSVPYSVQHVTIDPAQNVMIHCAIYQREDVFEVRLFIRKLAGKLACVTQVVPFPLVRGEDINHKISIDQLELCGKILGVSVSQRIGSERIASGFALVDWDNGKIFTWKTEVLSFQFLGENRLLVVLPPKDHEFRRHRHFAGQPVSGHVRPKRLAIHSLHDLIDSEAARMCTYELPPSWNGATVLIKTNTSPVSETPVASGTLFYPDPTRRIVVLAAVFSSSDNPCFKPSRRELIVVHEKFLSAINLPGVSNIPWDQWDQGCFFGMISPSNSSVHVIGTRVLYLEDVSVARNLFRRNIHVLDFNPDADRRCSASTLRRIGLWKTVTTKEHRNIPYFRTRTQEPQEISDFFATPDNLILLVNNRDAQGGQVTVLTFE